MKRAEDLKRISINAIKQKEIKEEELYLKVIFSKWFINIMKDIEEQVISIAKTGKQEMQLKNYKINSLNESYLFSEIDFLKDTFSRYFFSLGYDANIVIRPVYNLDDKFLFYYFTGSISW